MRQPSTWVVGLADDLDVLIKERRHQPEPTAVLARERREQICDQPFGPLLAYHHAEVGFTHHQRGEQRPPHLAVRFSDINLDDEVDRPEKGNKGVPKEEQKRPNIPAWAGERATDGFQGVVAYGMSKSANILFTVAVKRRLASKGVDRFALHPGGELNNLQDCRIPRLCRFGSSFCFGTCAFLSLRRFISRGRVFGSCCILANVPREQGSCGACFGSMP